MTIHGSTPDSQRITQNGITLGTILGRRLRRRRRAQRVGRPGVDVRLLGRVGRDGHRRRAHQLHSEGGRQHLHGASCSASFTNNSLQGSNFSQDLKDRGLLYPNLMTRIWDVNPGFGGPIARDRLWFYASVRSNGSWNYVPGMVYNRNANNPNGVDLRPRSRRARYRTTTPGGKRSCG